MQTARPPVHMLDLSKSNWTQIKENNAVASLSGKAVSPRNRLTSIRVWIPCDSKWVHLSLALIPLLTAVGSSVTSVKVFVAGLNDTCLGFWCWTDKARSFLGFTVNKQPYRDKQQFIERLMQVFHRTESMCALDLRDMRIRENTVQMLRCLTEYTFKCLYLTDCRVSRNGRKAIVCALIKSATNRRDLTIPCLTILHYWSGSGEFVAHSSMHKWLRDGNQALQDVCEQKSMQAFVLGTHHRVGQDTLMCGLPDDVLRIIGSFLTMLFNEH
jgi:hypothetical protein